jgi:predicted nucleic acid-binding protein
MIYVLDTNVIRTLLSFFPKKGKRYEEVWRMIDEKIQAGEFISVDECYNELARQFSDSTDQYQWFHAHKDMFKNPDDKESIIISQLLLKPKMRETVHLKNILENRPSADVYIAAKAKAVGATVVTNENYRLHSAQLPNLCEELNVPAISYDDFMEAIDQ